MRRIALSLALCAACASAPGERRPWTGPRLTAVVAGFRNASSWNDEDLRAESVGLGASELLAERLAATGAFELREGGAGAQALREFRARQWALGSGGILAEAELKSLAEPGRADLVVSAELLECHASGAGLFLGLGGFGSRSLRVTLRLVAEDPGSGRRLVIGPRTGETTGVYGGALGIEGGAPFEGSALAEAMQDAIDLAAWDLVEELR